MARTDEAVVGAVEQELELLLPWHATGRLSDREAARIERALAASPDLVSRFDEVRSERTETIRLNQELAAPSAWVLASLMADIEAECASKRHRLCLAGVAAPVSRTWQA